MFQAADAGMKVEHGFVCADYMNVHGILQVGACRLVHVIPFISAIACLEVIREYDDKDDEDDRDVAW